MDLGGKEESEVLERKQFKFKDDELALEEYEVDMELFADDTFTLTAVGQETGDCFVQARIEGDIDAYDTLYGALRDHSRGRDDKYGFKSFTIGKTGMLDITLTYPHPVSTKIKNLLMFNLSKVGKRRVRKKKKARAKPQPKPMPEPEPETTSTPKKKKKVIVKKIIRKKRIVVKKKPPGSGGKKRNVISMD